MKNSKKGFIGPLLIAIIVVLAVGGGIYVYEISKYPDLTLPEQGVVDKIESATSTSKSKPSITSISKSSGPIGTIIELKGYYLLADRGDQNLFIKNSKGEVATFGEGDPTHIDLSKKYVSMKFTLGEKACKQWITNAGFSCKSWMTIVPGEYKIYVGVVSDKATNVSVLSNEVRFIVTETKVSTTTNSTTTNTYLPWIKDLITKELSTPVANPPALLTQYEYNNQTVYYLRARCCDIPSTLYDENGSYICSPDGGFSGNGDGKCPSFSTTGQNGKVVWKDPR
jgi:hypothetical protein